MSGTDRQDQTRGSASTTYPAASPGRHTATTGPAAPLEPGDDTAAAGTAAVLTAPITQGGAPVRPADPDGTEVLPIEHDTEVGDPPTRTQPVVPDLSRLDPEIGRVTVAVPPDRPDRGDPKAGPGSDPTGGPPAEPASDHAAHPPWTAATSGTPPARDRAAAPSPGTTTTPDADTAGTEPDPTVAAGSGTDPEPSTVAMPGPDRATTGTHRSPGAAAPARHIGRYQIVRRIGVGGFATVYAAIDPQLDDQVAVKVLAENHAAEPELRRRFISEAQLARRVGNDRLIGVFDLGETEDDRPYVVMELADRGSLRNRIDYTPEVGLADVMRLVTELGACMEAIHARGVIHRDLKPRNLLLRTTSSASRGRPPRERRLLTDDERLVLADFGLARDISDGASGLTIGGGTAGYMAPEQADQAGSPDHRADLYAATMVVAEVITGDHPQRLSLATAPIPTRLRAALERGTALERDRRPDSAVEWRAMLLDALTDGLTVPETAPEVSVPPGAGAPTAPGPAVAAGPPPTAPVAVAAADAAPPLAQARIPTAPVAVAVPAAAAPPAHARIPTAPIPGSAPASTPAAAPVRTARPPAYGYDPELQHRIHHATEREHRRYNRRLRRRQRRHRIANMVTTVIRAVVGFVVTAAIAHALLAERLDLNLWPPLDVTGWPINARLLFMLAGLFGLLVGPAVVPFPRYYRR
ncbi:MAG: protein kinase domain-containing protein [Acidimicrobiales bacterium]